MSSLSNACSIYVNVSIILIALHNQHDLRIQYPKRSAIKVSLGSAAALVFDPSL